MLTYSQCIIPIKQQKAIVREPAQLHQILLRRKQGVDALLRGKIEGNKNAESCNCIKRFLAFLLQVFPLIHFLTNLV